MSNAQSSKKRTWSCTHGMAVCCRVLSGLTLLTQYSGLRKHTPTLPMGPVAVSKLRAGSDLKRSGARAQSKPGYWEQGRCLGSQALMRFEIQDCAQDEVPHGRCRHSMSPSVMLLAAALTQPFRPCS
jgi:hypothetical protein